MTASFGVAELAEGQSVDSLLRAADGALYRAKELGRTAWRSRRGIRLAVPSGGGFNCPRC